MMFQKARLFKDEDIAIEVLRAETPRQVRSLGRKVKNFDEATWLKHRREIVRHGNILKFTRAVTEEGYKKGSPSGNYLEGSLLDTLLHTGDRELVEASPFDRIWGIGFKAADAEAAREAWGENLLGKELMEVRSILKKKRDQGQL
jgi:predicted NAD-dependent protein-ADP-ribosyltransferase YbiA (DUF1768 family)